LETVDRTKGKFRSFILASLNHYLADWWDKQAAAKRGGGQEILPLEQVPQEQLATHCMGDASEGFDKAWALALLSKARNRLREEMTKAGKETLFDLLENAVFMEEPSRNEQSAESYASIAARSGSAEGSVKCQVSRLRRRYGELLRDEIAQTVSFNSQVDDEIRHLIEAVSKRL